MSSFLPVLYLSTLSTTTPRYMGGQVKSQDLHTWARPSGEQAAAARDAEPILGVGAAHAELCLPVCLSPGSYLAL